MPASSARVLWRRRKKSVLSTGMYISYCGSGDWAVSSSWKHRHSKWLKCHLQPNHWCICWVSRYPKERNDKLQACLNKREVECDILKVELAPLMPPKGSVSTRFKRRKGGHTKEFPVTNWRPLIGLHGSLVDLASKLVITMIWIGILVASLIYLPHPWCTPIVLLLQVLETIILRLTFHGYLRMRTPLHHITLLPSLHDRVPSVLEDSNGGANTECVVARLTKLVATECILIPSWASIDTLIGKDAWLTWMIDGTNVPVITSTEERNCPWRVSRIIAVYVSTVVRLQ